MDADSAEAFPDHRRSTSNTQSRAGTSEAGIVLASYIPSHSRNDNFICSSSAEQN